MKQYCLLWSIIVLVIGEADLNKPLHDLDVIEDRNNHGKYFYKAGCDVMEISVDSGANWVYIEWKLHCNISDPDDVRNYNLALIDNTSPDHWYDNNVKPDCRSTDCAFNVTLAHPCVNYTVTLKVINFDGEEFSYKDSEVVTGEEYPSEVRHLTVDETEKNSVKISWDPPHVGQFCVDHYEVCHRIIPSSKSLEKCETVSREKDSPTLSIENLTACHSYYITVAAVTYQGKMGKKNATIGNTMNDIPGDPQNVVLKDAAHDFVAFYWNLPDSNSGCITGIAEACKISTNKPIKGAHQQDSSKPITTYKTKNNNKLVGNTYSEVTNLKECTFYDCWVELLHSGDGRVISDNITTFTNVIGVTISKPTGVEVIQAGVDFLDVAWAFPERGSRCVDGYQLSWKRKEGVEVKEEVGKDVLEYKIENLFPCTTYDITIAGFSSSWGHSKDGQEEHITHKTSIIAPGKVENLKVLNNLTTQAEVTISWEYPSDNPQCVDTWNVHITQGHLDEDCNSQTKVFEKTHFVSHKIPCLICSNNYTISVEAVSENGLMSGSSSVIAKTEDC